MSKPNPAVAIVLVVIGAFVTGLGFAGAGSDGTIVTAFFFMIGLTALVLGGILFSHSLG